MKPNILKFWFWRARLMVAGLHEHKEKFTKISINDELSIELHPTNGSDQRPYLKLCRQIDGESQSINIFLKEVPLLIDFLPRSIAQLMVLNAEHGPQQLHPLHKVRRMDLLKSSPELVE
ncbi:MAG: hypothetical protein Fur0044_31640 [Anaerolineae bacterium]|nr:hypothetical protein [Anaerolineales bacterium]MCQ3973250.1 hypothetical protein [Anaerolineae bacterium]